MGNLNPRISAKKNYFVHPAILFRVLLASSCRLAMYSQVVRNPSHLAPCRSLIRQHLVRLASTSNSTDPAPLHISAGTAGNAKKAKEIDPDNRRTAYIRTWEPVKNVADAWAIIRVLERKYGKIITAHFLKVLSSSCWSILIANLLLYRTLKAPPNTSLCPGLYSRIRRRWLAYPKQDTILASRQRGSTSQLMRLV